MKRFILTGAPGAGKTAILRRLEADGFSVVEEAATDIIALRAAEGLSEPHARPDFTADIVSLQRLRRLRAARADAAVQIHDRSAVCTLALARWLGHPVSQELAEELAAIAAGHTYERAVFFVEMMAFITPTAARQISYADSIAFGRLHEEVYAELGYALVRIPPAPLRDRVARIKAALSAFGG